MRIYLLSCANREDVVAYWFFCKERFWPDCPYPITVSDSSKKHGWARTMQKELEHFSDKYVMLWLDDQFLSVPVGDMFMGAIYAQLFWCPELAGIQLARIPWADGESLPYLRGYAFYKYKDPTYHMTQIVPGIWKREALLGICDFLRKNLARTMDRDWTGAYNYELYAPRHLKQAGLRVAGPTSEEYITFSIYNGVVQNRWSPIAVAQAQELGYPLDTRARPIYKEGMDAYVDQWREDARSGRRLDIWLRKRAQRNEQ